VDVRGGAAGEQLRPHGVHCGVRTKVEATKFLRKVKDRSDREAPLFLSDAWFY